MTQITKVRNPRLSPPKIPHFKACLVKAKSQIKVSIGVVAKATRNVLTKVLYVLIVTNLKTMMVQVSMSVACIGWNKLKKENIFRKPDSTSKKTKVEHLYQRSPSTNYRSQLMMKNSTLRISIIDLLNGRKWKKTKLRS